VIQAAATVLEKSDSLLSWPEVNWYTSIQCSMFRPKVLEAIRSKYSGQIEVRRLGWDTYVTTAGLTQSGGLVKELWEKTLKKLKPRDVKYKSWLILGLSTGTVAKIISDKYSPTRMVGVEIDPEMIRVGRQYFGLDNITHLEILNLDARRYILNAAEKFDIAIVDLYVSDRLPEFVYSKDFLGKLGQLGKLVIVNHLFYDSYKKARAEELVETLKGIYPNLKLHRELTNLLVICS